MTTSPGGRLLASLVPPTVRCFRIEQLDSVTHPNDQN